MASEKLDLYKLHKDQYITPKKPEMVKTKPAKYLTITGKGDPGVELFSRKIQALYNVVYMIKMTKKFDRQDYVVCRLEGLWWGSKGPGDFSNEPQKELSKKSN